MRKTTLDILEGQLEKNRPREGVWDPSIVDKVLEGSGWRRDPFASTEGTHFEVLSCPLPANTEIDLEGFLTEESGAFIKDTEHGSFLTVMVKRQWLNDEEIDMILQLERAVAPFRNFEPPSNSPR
jgi:hypothetical protein